MSAGTRNCDHCGGQFWSTRTSNVFCSIKCSAAKRWSDPAERARNSRPHSEATRAKMSASQKRRMADPVERERLAAINRGRIGAENRNWRGNRAKYSAIHTWLRRHFPKTGTCEDCGREVGVGRSGTQYAYRFHPLPYTRDRTDYLELCPKCHGRERRKDRVA